MRAARMHGYNQPLVLEDVPIPEIEPNEVLGAAGMCRTDVQLLDGYFRPYSEATFPLTPGHEIAGEVHKIGSLVPKSAGFEEGDQVVVVGGWGDETCRHCHEGNTQICSHGRWPGFGPYGGYAEYVSVPIQYLIKVDKRYGLKAEELAPHRCRSYAISRHQEAARCRRSCSESRVGRLRHRRARNLPNSIRQTIGWRRDRCRLWPQRGEACCCQGAWRRPRHRHQGKIDRRHSQRAGASNRSARGRCGNRLRRCKGDDPVGLWPVVSRSALFVR